MTTVRVVGTTRGGERVNGANALDPIVISRANII